MVLPVRVYFQCSDNQCNAFSIALLLLRACSPDRVVNSGSRSALQCQRAGPGSTRVAIQCTCISVQRITRYINPVQCSIWWSSQCSLSQASARCSPSHLRRIALDHETLLPPLNQTRAGESWKLIYFLGMLLFCFLCVMFHFNINLENSNWLVLDTCEALSNLVRITHFIYAVHRQF